MDVRMIDQAFLERIKKLGLPALKDSNPYVVLSVRGDGRHAPEKWNAKVYRNNKGGLKLVTVDLQTLEDIMTGKIPEIKKNILRVDDAGWGFPIGGVMIGVTDEKRVETDIIDVKYFRGDFFADHEYLGQAAAITLRLIKRFDASPADTGIEICSGYINSRSKEVLRDEGYDVKVVEVTGLLQDELERRFKEYIYTLGYRSYYDPKVTSRIDNRFNSVIKWIKEDPARMKLAKTGWDYFIRSDKNFYKSKDF